MRLRLPGSELDLQPGRPLLMGIVNASPDSFSDGGDLPTLDHQVARGLAQVAEGATIIDVGGESGVTNTPVTDADAEAALVVPLVRGLAEAGVMVSVDTWKATVADRALEAGASIINDVSGLRDPALAEVCAARGGALVVMHTRSAPKVKEFPHYDDVRADVLAFLEERLALARAAGLDDDQLVVDPGPDFSKTPAQTIEVLRHLDDLQRFGRPVLLAVSRKDFVGALTLAAPQDRAEGTLAAVGD
ncbi:MAG: dihydropteroate synthase, partial [Acidobacteria bacterium]|nr:dihydropteroate synthase [Acidobacteriota bacterium]